MAKIKKKKTFQKQSLDIELFLRYCTVKSIFIAKNAHICLLTFYVTLKNDC